MFGLDYHLVSQRYMSSHCKNANFACTYPVLCRLWHVCLRLLPRELSRCFTKHITGSCTFLHYFFLNVTVAIVFLHTGLHLLKMPQPGPTACFSVTPHNSDICTQMHTLKIQTGERQLEATCLRRFCVGAKVRSSTCDLTSRQAENNANTRWSSQLFSHVLMRCVHSSTVNLLCAKIKVINKSKTGDFWFAWKLFCSFAHYLPALSGQTPALFVFLTKSPVWRKTHFTGVSPSVTCVWCHEGELIPLPG